jgi:hypothetical protein
MMILANVNDKEFRRYLSRSVAETDKRKIIFWKLGTLFSIFSKWYTKFISIKHLLTDGRNKKKRPGEESWDMYHKTFYGRNLFRNVETQCVC